MLFYWDPKGQNIKGNSYKQLFRGLYVCFELLCLIKEPLYNKSYHKNLYTHFLIISFGEVVGVL